MRKTLCVMAILILIIGIVVILMATVIEYEDEISPIGKLESLEEEAT